MGIFFAYIFKSALCLAAFYLFYRLLLSNETFHRFNRFALLSLILLSCLIPFIKYTVESTTAAGSAVQSVEELLLMYQWNAHPATSASEASPAWTWAEALVLLYFAGVLFFAIRTLWSMGKLSVLIRRNPHTRMENGVRLVTHELPLSPFSWMRYIIISRKDLKENGNDILTHELAHIRHHHSWDVLLTEVCLCLQWFNPAIWLLKQELQNIHEYEADEEVLRQGIDAKHYQMLLIKKAVGARLYSIANSFNHSSLKKRITMMIRKKSNPWARAKYLYVLPLAAVAVAAFARPEISQPLDEISSVKVNDFPAIAEASAAKISTDAAQVMLKMKVVDEKGAPVVGAAIVVYNTTNGTISDKEGNFSLNVNEDQSIVCSYIGMKSQLIPVKDALKMKQITLTTEAINIAELPETSGQPEAITRDGQTYEVVENMPEYPGGMPELLKFLARNIKYPTEAQKKGIQGRVIAQFIVKKDGSTDNIRIVRSISPELDAEAIRVLKLMPKWKPGTQRGVPQDVWFTVPVTFALQAPDGNMPATEEGNPAVVVVGYANNKTSAPEHIPAADGSTTDAASRSPSEKLFQVVEDMPEYPGGMAACLKFIKDNIRYPEELKKQGIKGRVIVQFTVQKDGTVSDGKVVRSIHPQLDAEALRVLTLMPKWKPGTQRGEAVNVKYTLPITFSPDKDKAPAPLVLIDGKESSTEDMNQLPPDQIEQITVLKDPASISKYGEKGKHGVVCITTKK